MNIAFPPIGIGSIIAILVAVVALVFALTGQMDWQLAGCLIALAIARLT